MATQSSPLSAILSNLKINALNAMQQEMMDSFEQHPDLVLLSPTGSGKTLGFLLPLYLSLKPEVKHIQALIVVPTRELALQIEEVFKSMKTGFKVNTCYGGHDMEIEENNLSHPPALLIGTPGRLVDHINRKNFEVKSIEVLVLDEFDKSLEMGFQEEMGHIIKHLKGIKKRILVSATQSIQIPDFTGVQDPAKINYLSDKVAGLKIQKLSTDEKEKFETLYKLICALNNEPAIIFCNHRDTVERICEYLEGYEVVCNNFHGGLEQNYRESTLTKFRNGSTNVLVTTDLAARGLDIPQVKYIVHYQLPPKQDAFTHRNGRTARMDAEGTAIIIQTKEDQLPEYIQSAIEEFEMPVKTNLPKLPQWETLFIGAGKKDKINKVDIVGFLCQKGQLKKEELGLIEVKDMYAYAAVKRSNILEVISLVRNEKIKNKKVKIEIARDTPKM